MTKCRKCGGKLDPDDSAFGSPTLGWEHMEPCPIAELRGRIGMMITAGTEQEKMADLERLIALADRMFAEHAAKVQETSNAEYQAEFGHNGPRIASPLHSAGREYVFWRHRYGEKHGLPDASKALGQT